VLFRSAAFVRSLRNFTCDPPTDPTHQSITVYHCQPHGNRDALRRPIRPEIFVDIESVLHLKRQALSCHKSQSDFLATQQNLDAYVDSMEYFNREVAALSHGRYRITEGWRMHNHLGFCGLADNPLIHALRDFSCAHSQYLRTLKW